MKRMFAALLVMTMTTGAFAQGVIYNPSNTPTTGGTNSWPFNVYTDWRFSFIIDASVLPAAEFKITDIAFAPTATRGWAAPQFQMRMNETALTTYGATVPPAFDTVLGNCPTIVYDGPIRWSCTAGTWSPIGLQCSFGYNGSATPQPNIVCELRYQKRSTTGVTTKTDVSINRAYTHNSYSADPYNEPLWQVPIPGEALGPKHCLTIDRTCVLIASRRVRVGGTAGIQIFNAPTAASYQIAASLAQGPPFSVGPCTICLAVDGLFFASVFGGPPTFNGYRGVISTQGTGAAKLLVPNIPALAGICVYHAGLVIQRGRVVCCTNTDGTLITP